MFYKISPHHIFIYRYPAINKPAGVVHWIENNEEARDVDWVVILDADMVIRHPILPWKLGAEKGKPVAALYGYAIQKHKLGKERTKEKCGIDICFTVFLIIVEIAE